MRFRSVGFCVAVPLAASILAPLPALANRTTDVRVQCAEGRAFLLRLDPRRATIIVGNRRLDLRRKPSSLGQYYRNAKAVLIVDGDFVAFVPREDREWRDCRIDGRPMTQPKD